MKAVPNCGNYCSLACLESYLADHGQPVDWESLRDTFAAAGFASSEGAVWTIGAFCRGCELAGLHAEEVPVEIPIPPKYSDGSLFIFWEKPSFHCVRFHSQPETGKLVVMDPNVVRQGFDLRWLDKADFESANCKFVRVAIA